MNSVEQFFFKPKNQGVSNLFGNITENAATNLNQNLGLSLSKDSYLLKFMFLIGLLIAFMILVRIGTRIINYLLSPSETPYLVKGMKDATELRVIEQDPSISNSIPIMRSTNEDNGIEFSYSTWIYIKDVPKDGHYQNVFVKGNINNSVTSTFADSGEFKGLALPDNGPGVYINPLSNNQAGLTVFMNTYQNTDIGNTSEIDVNNYMKVTENVEITNLPLRKWLHLVIRVKGKALDVYMNGTIVKRHILSGIPRQNYGNVFVNYNGGFNGMISSLRYFNYAISPTTITNLTKAGPNTKIDRSILNFPPFFGLQWYLTNNQ